MIRLIFIYITGVISTSLFVRVIPDVVNYEYSNFVENIPLSGSQTQWTNLTGCQGFNLTTSCTTSNPLNGYTDIIRVTQFGIEQVPNGITLTTMLFNIKYSVNIPNVIFEINDLQMISGGIPVGNKLDKVAVLSPTATTCCNDLVITRPISNFGINLFSNDVNDNNNFGIQFSVNRTGGPIAFPEFRTLGMRVAYLIAVDVYSVSPNYTNSNNGVTIDIYGRNFLNLNNNGVLCKVGTTTFQGILVNDTNVICNSPDFRSGTYPVRISINNGTLYSTELFEITFGPDPPSLSPTSTPTSIPTQMPTSMPTISCSLSGQQGVTCNLNTNIIQGFVTIYFNNPVVIDNLQLTSSSTIVSNNTILLSGVLTIVLDEFPTQNLLLTPITASMLNGQFDNLILSIPNNDTCKQLIVRPDYSSQTSMSVAINIDSSQCNVFPILEVSIACSVAILSGIALGIIVGVVRNMQKKKFQQEAQVRIMDNQEHDLERSMKQMINDCNK